MIMWTEEDKSGLELVSGEILVTLSGTEVPGSAGIKGISSEKEGISTDKGTPRTIQASYLHGEPKRNEDHCWLLLKLCLQIWRQAGSRIHMLSHPPLSQYEVV